MKKEYTLYKGEDILASGTVEELAKKFGVKKETIYYYTSPANMKKDKGNRRVAVKVN